MVGAPLANDASQEMFCVILKRLISLDFFEKDLARSLYV